ncbi:class I SAM-dependent methyltransferase [Chloroflexota bacterium]
MSSYRRILLDFDLEMSKSYMTGIVLDIGGGRRRGSFKPPVDASWVILDIYESLYPHILGNAHNIPIKSNLIDCVKCTDLLEHVEYPRKVLKEVSRVLKPSGVLILSVPFNYPIHGDPYDFQRFTDEKLRRILKDDFQILTLKRQGLYFTVLADTIKSALLNSRSSMKRLFYPFLPVLDLLVRIDNRSSVKNSKFMNSFTTGFFVIAVADKRM